MLEAPVRRAEHAPCAGRQERALCCAGMPWELDEEPDQRGLTEVERAQRRLAQNGMKRSLFGGLPVRLGALITVVIAAAVIGWLVFGQSNNKKSSISNPGSAAGGT